MANNQIKTRIIHKHDTAANWELATNFIPKQGEIIIYDKDSAHNYERLKIGDGQTLVSNLPFVDDAAKYEIVALATDVNNISAKVDEVGNLVGDTSVADQINAAISENVKQPDWNAADGEDGHILNRTHWSKLGLVDVIPEGLYYLQNRDALMKQPIYETIQLGNQYIAVYNNTEYPVTAKEGDFDGVRSLLLGNPNIFNSDFEPSTEPFCLVVFQWQYAIDYYNAPAIICSNDVNCSFALKKEGDVVHKLDPKFYERTHWVETVETEIFSNLTFPNVTIGTQCPLLETYPVEEGKEYKITYNGYDYICKPSLQTFENLSGVAIGNYMMAMGEGSTGEPFCLAFFDSATAAAAGYGGILVTFTNSSTVTVSMSEINEVIHKIPSKFFDVATEDEIIELLASLDMFPVITDADGSILTDENDAILLV